MRKQGGRITFDPTVPQFVSLTIWIFDGSDAYAKRLSGSSSLSNPWHKKYFLTSRSRRELVYGFYSDSKPKTDRVRYPTLEMDLILLGDEKPEIIRRVTNHEGIIFSFLKRKMSSGVKIVYGVLHRETNLQPVNKRYSRGIWKCWRRDLPHWRVLRALAS